MPTFDPKKFTTQEARPIPIILLLDVSTSMAGEKIDSLNAAVNEMLNSFRELGELSTVIAVISFGSQVRSHYEPPYMNSSEIQWTDLTISGSTPMGEALKMAKAMVDDKETTKGKWYRPLAILVSDGQPTDSWEQPMDDFISEGRSSKCDRMAMAIGQGADEGVLGRFIAGTENKLFYAHDAKDIRNFFKLVTMSVSVRSKSKDPNVIPQAEPLDKSNSSKDSRDYF
jgi:uncharacterized protein YegL